MKSTDKRIQVLKKAAKDKRIATLGKANDAINYMLENNLAINFSSVAEVAGISKTCLYQYPKIKSKIEKYRKNTNCLSYESLHNKYTKIMSENTRVKRKNSSLQKEINSLKQQLEAVYGELYKVKKSRNFSI
jgi:succinate dehydrogenase/fumarate reductase flavoprotein subunit